MKIAGGFGARPCIHILATLLALARVPRGPGKTSHVDRDGDTSHDVCDKEDGAVRTLVDYELFPVKVGVNPSCYVWGPMQKYERYTHAYRCLERTAEVWVRVSRLHFGLM